MVSCSNGRLFNCFFFRFWGIRIGKYVLVFFLRFSMLEISLCRMFFFDINNLFFFLRLEVLVKLLSRLKRFWVECEFVFVISMRLLRWVIGLVFFLRLYWFYGFLIVLFFEKNWLFFYNYVEEKGRFFIFLF